MSDPKAYPLEPSADEMRTMLEQVTNRVIEHIDSLPAQPASYDTDGREVANSFAETLPETGTDTCRHLLITLRKASPGVVCM